MGRTRTKNKKSVPSLVDSPAKTSTSPAPSVESLLAKAQTLIIECDYEMAIKFAQRVLEREPSNAEGKEVLGVIQLETGDLPGAKQTFLSLLPPNPDAPSPSPPAAHLYLAQLSDDDPKTALQHYQAAVDILSLRLKGKAPSTDVNSDPEEAETRNHIVRALVGMVEIWMDPSYDLCFDPAAEQTCEELLQLALKTDPGNAEALQALASVRMSQQRPEDAKQCLELAWTAWKDLDLDDPRLPPIPTRLALVRLFLELSLFAPALLVLHGVMSTDDQEVEAWYLEGWCFFIMAEQAKDKNEKMDELTWEELARDARDCLETCQVLHRNEEHPDIPLLEHAQELIAKLQAVGIQPSPAPVDGEDDGEGDEWEDDASDGDDVEMK